LIFLYNIFISLYTLFVRTASLWNSKAKQWVEGRKSLWQELDKQNFSKESIVWIHASSAGEFEQAKPVIEALKKSYPVYKILVSFFSPSGYIAAKNYKGADYTYYLPVDQLSNAKRFIKNIKPRLVIFVKYDFWYHHLHTIHEMKIPLLLISAVFRKEQIFFKWYGGLYHKMLQFFNFIFVQDRLSYAQLKGIGVNNCMISGDTRFDRVTEIASNFTELPFIKEFIGTNNVLIAGSTWPEDEKLLKNSIYEFSELKLIIAPHEINKQHIHQIQKDFPTAILYSQIKEQTISKNKILIIDNVGMLAKLYYYATITYVGGGFTKDGIHNILEAAVYGKPVLFGPNYKKYREATELINYGGAFSASTSQELKIYIKNFLSGGETYRNAGRALREYIDQNKGASGKIINYIQEKRLLTN
jgi:3-deoxy-D-manno-octulosonic-acid transferase